MLTQLSLRDTWYRVGLALLAVVLGGGLGFAVISLDNPVLAIAAVGGIIFAFFTITNSNFGLLVLVFVIYTRFSDVMVHTHNTPSVLQPYLLLVLVGIVARWVFHREPSRDWVRVTAFILAYAVVVFSSLFYASDFAIAQESGLDFLKDGIITIILVVLINRAAIAKKVIWTLLIAGIFLGTISTYQGISGSYENEFWGFGRTGVQNIIGVTEGHRVTGPMSDPNYYAQLILVLVPLAINRLLNEKHWFLKVLAGWAMVVCSLTVVFSFSRGAVVAAVLMGIYVLLVQPPRISDLVLGGVVLAVILFFMPANYMTRIATIPDVLGGTNSVRGEVSFRGRASETIVAWLMFMDNPIFGVGVNNYPVFYQKYSRTLGLDPRVEQRQAHNLYLQIAAETGLAGIIVYGGILWSIFAGLENAWRRLQQARLDEYASMFFSFEVGMIGYLSAALFIHAAYPRYFWLLAGIAFSLPQIADKLLVSNTGFANE